MLSQDEFELAFSSIWSHRLQQYSHSIENIYSFPALTDFKELVTNNTLGLEMLQELWDYFNLWWWPDFGGHKILEKTSDELVIPIANSIAAQFNANHHQPTPEQLLLIVIFREVPFQLPTKDLRFCILPLSELSKNNAEYSISKCFYDLINKPF